MTNRIVMKIRPVSLVVAAMLLFPALLFAAVPRTLNYQGYLTTSAGVPVTSAGQLMTFRIYTVSTGGTALWTETRSVAVTDGIYKVGLGEVTPFSLAFDVPYYLGIQIGFDPEMVPRQLLASVPTALRAATAETVPDGTITAVKLADGAVTDAKVSGSISGAKIAPGTIPDDRLSPNVQKKYGRVAVVAKSGGDYIDPIAAMNDLAAWCGTPSVGNTCILKIMPGSYGLGFNSLVMQSYVDIEGSGEGITELYGQVEGAATPPAAGVVNGANFAEIRFISVRNIGVGINAGVVNSNASPKLTHVTVRCSGGGNWSYGIVNDHSSPTLSNVTVRTDYGFNNFGVYNTNLSSPDMREVSVYAILGTNNYGVYNSASQSRMNNVVIESRATPGGLIDSKSYGIYNISSSSDLNNVSIRVSGGRFSDTGIYGTSSSNYTIRNSSISVLGGALCYGIENSSSSLTVDNVQIDAGGTPTGTYGLYNYPSSTGFVYDIGIDNSYIKGTTNSIFNDAASNTIVRIGGSNLAGIAVNAFCLASYDAGNFKVLNLNCQYQ